MTAMRFGHDFAAERAQLGRMRFIRQMMITTGAALLLAAGAASAQTAGDAPIATTGGGAGGVPTAAEPGPAEVRQTPAPPPVQPLADFRQLEAVAEEGRRAPLLGDYHGEVGGVVGTNGLRGAYGHIIAHPNDHVAIDLRFSTIHQHGYGYPYGGGIYDRGARYRPDLDELAPDPMAPPEH